jgi:hypothetical protein
MALKDWKILDTGKNKDEFIYTKDGKDHISLVPAMLPGEKGRKRKEKIDTHWEATHLESGKKVGFGRSRGQAIGSAVESLEGNVKKTEDEAGKLKRFINTWKVLHHEAHNRGDEKEKARLSGKIESAQRTLAQIISEEPKSDVKKAEHEVVKKGYSTTAIDPQKALGMSKNWEVTSASAHPKGTDYYFKGSAWHKDVVGADLHENNNKVWLKLKNGHFVEKENPIKEEKPETNPSHKAGWFETMKSEDVKKAEKRHPLEELGFKRTEGSSPKDSHWHGTIDAEDYDVGKDHFTPKFRDVYHSGETSGREGKFHYVTSSIHGTMRPYRAKNSFETSVGNIFGSGKTAEEALSNFSANFKKKKYNVSKSEEKMNNFKDAVKKAIMQKVRQWLMKATETHSVVVDSGADKAAAELYKAKSPDYVDFDEEIKKSDPSALDKWEPNPWVAKSEQKGRFVTIGGKSKYFEDEASSIKEGDTVSESGFNDWKVIKLHDGQLKGMADIRRESGVKTTDITGLKKV